MRLTQRTIAIEGAGDVIKQYYFPALRKLRGEGREFAVTFADNSEYWADNPPLRTKMEGIRAELIQWGATYLDKASATGLRQWQDLLPDVLIIATPDRTHVKLALEWLAKGAAPKVMFIEKPLDASIDAVRDLLGRLSPYDPAVLSFDHYRARLLPARAKFDMLHGFFRLGLKRFTFYFLEDHSGADPAYAGDRGGRQGPIENDRRVGALNGGVILDIMPHVIALLAHFGRVETLRVTQVRAGKYTGVDGLPEKESEIDGETFAEVRFLFRSYRDEDVEGVAFVGKGVKGVGALGPDHDRNSKLLEIEGVGGRRAVFDLRSAGRGAHSRARLLDEGDFCQLEFPLNAEPYYTFLQNVVSTDGIDERIGLPVEVGKKILEVIQDMRYPVLARSGRLPAYPCGIQQSRESLTLEQLVEPGATRLPLLYGRESEESEERSYVQRR